MLDTSVDSNLSGMDIRDEAVFTTGEIATLVDVSLDEIDYWVRCNLLIPSIRVGSGTGNRRLFNRADLRVALLIQRLRSARWKPKQILRALQAVGSALKNPSGFHTPILVHEGNALLILCWKRGMGPVLLDAASPGQYVMVIALETLEEETRINLVQSK